MVEYALLLALVAVVSVGAMQFLGDSASVKVKVLGTAIETSGAGTPTTATPAATTGSASTGTATSGGGGTTNGTNGVGNTTNGTNGSGNTTNGTNGNTTNGHTTG